MFFLYFSIYSNTSEVYSTDRLIRITNTIVIPTVIWLNYCRYGVKHYPINQSLVHDAVEKMVVLNAKIKNRLMYADKVVFKSRIDIVKNKKVPLFNR